MASAKLRINPARTAFEVDLPDGTEEGGPYNPGEGAIVISEKDTPYFVTFDHYEEPGMKPNTVYALTEVSTIAEFDCADVEEDDDDDDDLEEDDDLEVD